MASLTLIKGPAQSGRTAWAIRQCLEKAGQHRPLTVLLPSQPLIRDFRRRLSASENFTGALNLEFHTFYSFVKKYHDLSGDPVTEMESAHLPIVLGRFLEDRSEQYLALASSAITDGHLNALLAYFKDMADGALGSDRAVHLAEEPGLGGPSKRLPQIHRLYGEFSAYLLDHGFAMREQLFLRLWQRLGTQGDPDLAARDYIVDGFYDFTPVQRLLLQRLLELGTSCGITLLTGEDRIFEYVRETEQWLDALVDRYGGVTERRTGGETLLPEVEKLFQNRDGHPTPSGLDRIEATGPALEVQEVVRRIKRTLLTGESRPRDIAVLYRREDTYYNRLVAHCAREGIPLAGGVEQPLVTNPAMNALMQWYEVLTSNFSREEMLRWLQSNYIAPAPVTTHRQVARLKRLVDRARIIEGRDEWALRMHSLLTRDSETENNELERSSALSEPDKRLIRQVIHLLDELPPEETTGWGSHIRHLRKVVEITGFERRLRHAPELPEDVESRQGMDRDLNAYTKLQRLLDEMARLADLLDLPAIPTRRFGRILREQMEQTLYQAGDGNENGVTLTTIEGARGRCWNTVYLVGMMDGVFPIQWRAHPLVKLRDRRRVNRYLSGGRKIVEHRADLAEERLLFYIALSRARSTLCVSTIKGPEDSLPSPFYDELCQFYNGGSPEGRTAGASTLHVVSPDFYSFHPEDSWLQIDLLQHLVRWDTYPADHFPVASRLLNHLKDVTRERAGSRFGRYDGHLNSEAIHQRLTETFSDPASPLSASRLETYYTSPFQYFATYLLHLEEVEEITEELPPRDRGRILHRILERFYRLLTDRFQGRISPHDSPQILAELDNIIDAVCEEFKQAFSAIPDLLWAREQELLRSYSHNAVEFFSRAAPWSEPGFMPEYFELDFGTGRAGSLDPFPLSRGEKTVTFKGIVDRLDRKTDTGEYTVVDYKTSRGKAVKDFWTGRALQLQIYAMAVRQLLAEYDTPVRLSYYSLKHTREAGKVDGHSTDMEALLATAEQRIWEAVEAMAAGIFHPVAGECDEYCPVKTICRCDENRIRMKQT